MSLSRGIVCDDMNKILSISKILLLLLPLMSGCREGTSSSDSTSQKSSTPEKKSESIERTVPEPETMIFYEDVTSSTGVDFTYRNDQEAEQYSILETLGGGVAVFDYDRNGRLDLFFTGGGDFGDNHSIRGRPGALYRQVGLLQFEDVTQASNTAFAPVYSHGAMAADYNNDGFTDLLVTGYGRLLLLRNEGDGTFSDVTEVSGLIEDTLWSTSAAWADLNHDGLLDLYVAHYLDWSFDNNPVCMASASQRDTCAPRDFSPLPDIFFTNRGEGSFENATASSGLKPNGKGLGVVAGDVDLDGDTDLYVANDEVPNFLYRNDGQGHLEEVALMTGTSVNDVGNPEGSMGVDLTDFNLDGLPDLWCVNFENESLALYRNEGEGFFQYVSQAIGIKGITTPAVSWGTVFFDADCDLDEDVFIANGHVLRHPANAPIKQTPFMLENQSGQKFRNVSAEVGDYFSEPQMGRGVGLGDLNDDGRLDLTVSHMNHPAAVLINRTDHQHHWVGFRLIGRESPRDGIGARIELRVGEQKIVRQIKGGGSYASTNDLRVHFGLSGHEEIEQITIYWPSGIQQSLKDVPIDRYHTLVEPVSSLTDDKP